jgi:hypothetical protein
MYRVAQDEGNHCIRKNTGFFRYFYRDQVLIIPWFFLNRP